MSKLTYPAARARILSALRAKGWAVVDTLKVPHATPPSKTLRVWFKSQAVYLQVGGDGRGGGFDLGSAHSLHSDIRYMTPEQFEADVNHTVAIREGRS